VTGKSKIKRGRDASGKRCLRKESCGTEENLERPTLRGCHSWGLPIRAVQRKEDHKKGAPQKKYYLTIGKNGRNLEKQRKEKTSGNREN